MTALILTIAWIGALAFAAFAVRTFARARLSKGWRRMGWWSAGAVGLFGAALNNPHGLLGSIPWGLGMAGVILLGTLLRARYAQEAQDDLERHLDANPELRAALERSGFVRRFMPKDRKSN